MAGARKLVIAFLQRAHQALVSFLGRAMSFLGSVSAAYAQHQIIERVARSRRALWCNLGHAYHALAARAGEPGAHLAYFVSISGIGYLVLAALKLRAPEKRPRRIDVFFTSVSAATVSSMSTVEIEVFSNAQLVVLTVLMLIGGEVVTSLAELLLASRLKPAGGQVARIEAVGDDTPPRAIEMPAAATDNTDAISAAVAAPRTADELSEKLLRRNALLSLAVIVLAILVVVHVFGSGAILAYVLAVPGARRTLRSKGLNPVTFAVFTTVSTFSSCGFVPTNENMMVFKKDTGLQLLIVPQALVGNTLFPPLLVAAVWAARKVARGRAAELGYVLQKGRRELGFYHLLPARRCWMLALTVAAFVAAQVAALCALEWRGALGGLSAWEKAVNALFLAVNARHTGESTLDLSTIAPAILVLYVLMMYLPPYTTWFPFDEQDERSGSPSDDHHRWDRKEKYQRMGLLKSTVLSQLSYLTIFVILICITERRKLRDDPLNFNVLSIVVEVVSAYGNVGFSMGYSCSRQINPEPHCIDRWTGFAGRWSDSGKIILIIVMFFGRLKKFSMKGGRAWKLS